MAEGSVPADATPLRLRVLYSDLDGMAIVYHGRYFPWFENGRDEYLRARGYPYRELEASGVRLAVIEARARYRAPARYDDPILVYTWLRAADRVRLQFAYRVLHEVTNQVLVEAEVEYAFVGTANTPLRITHLPAVWDRLQTALALPPDPR
jgi:acyl-CoA thioester hydrolase